MKIIFRAPNWLGDAVVSRILLYNLRGNEITVLCRKHLKDIFYDFECVTFTTKKELFSRCLELRRQHFDLGVVIPLSFSSAFYMYIVHPPERIGFSFEGRDIFLTKKVKIPDDWKGKHTIFTQFLLIEKIGIQPVLPDIYYTPLCKTQNLKTKESSYITIAPFAAFGSAKEWGFKNYIELSERVFKKYGFKTIILGSEKDALRVSKQSLPDFMISKAGKTTITEAACIIKYSQIFIGNDSGLSHLSAAMGHPTVTIFGPTSPIWTKPIGIASEYLWKPPGCAPCYKRECPFNTKQCMNNISVEDVLNKIETVLNNIHKKGL